MPRSIAGLEERKDDIRAWIVNDGVKVVDVVAKLKDEHNVVCQKRTHERNLKIWGISRRSRLDKAALQADLTRLFRGPQQTDGAICELLIQAGHVINVRTVMETRKKLGLHKRIRAETNEQELQNTIKHLLDNEYQDEGVVKMQRSELYTYLRHKYPEHDIIGRDRVYNIAREMNPRLKRRYPKGHPLYQNRPYKLFGKRLAAKLAANAAKEANDCAGAAEEGHNPADAAKEGNDCADAANQGHKSAAVQAADESTCDEHYDPPPIDDHHTPPPPQQQPSVQYQSTIAPSQPCNSIYSHPPTTPHLLDPSLRVESLEKENDFLHYRLQQQEVEIQHMRQAYHDLMARINSVNRTQHDNT
ncbi:hypothetical protein E4T44_00867 [Aureobasidium sp. EXF-8845]|nr:hypothetical protein E4T44_00867 [Aureobasidium sp. EXF-8845]KAI4857999.1 hypothetical protein E4T45_00493 [Aureobasidium sp. EXF-8846]